MSRSPTTAQGRAGRSPGRPGCGRSARAVPDRRGRRAGRAWPPGTSRTRRPGSPGPCGPAGCTGPRARGVRRGRRSRSRSAPPLIAHLRRARSPAGRSPGRSGSLSQRAISSGPSRSTPASSASRPSVGPRGTAGAAGSLVRSPRPGTAAADGHQTAEPHRFAEGQRVGVEEAEPSAGQPAGCPARRYSSARICPCWWPGAAHTASAMSSGTDLAGPDDEVVADPAVALQGVRHRVEQLRRRVPGPAARRRRHAPPARCRSSGSPPPPAARPGSCDASAA